MIVTPAFGVLVDFFAMIRHPGGVDIVLYQGEAAHAWTPLLWIRQ
jgi:hypothetical protein